MSEQLIATQAKDTYETLCHTLDALEWSYNKCEEDLRIECYAWGEDLPIDITVRVDAERMLVLLISNIPFHSEARNDSIESIPLAIISNLSLYASTVSQEQ